MVALFDELGESVDDALGFVRHRGTMWRHSRAFAARSRGHRAPPFRHLGVVRELRRALGRLPSARGKLRGGASDQVSRSSKLRSGTAKRSRWRHWPSKWHCGDFRWRHWPSRWRCGDFAVAPLAIEEAPRRHFHAPWASKVAPRAVLEASRAHLPTQSSTRSAHDSLDSAHLGLLREHGDHLAGCDAPRSCRGVSACHLAERLFAPGVPSAPAAWRADHFFFVSAWPVGSVRSVHSARSSSIASQSSVLLKTRIVLVTCDCAYGEAS